MDALPASETFSIYLQGHMAPHPQQTVTTSLSECLYHC